VAGDENDRNLQTRLGQFALHIESTHAWESYVQYQATWTIWELASQKLLRAGKRLGAQTYRLQQTLHRSTHLIVIINDEDRSIIAGAHACAVILAGSVN
jgi:hypothetical protein